MKITATPFFLYGQIFGPIGDLPCLPGAFHARFPVSVKTCWPVADEAPCRTREKTCGTQGIGNRILTGFNCIGSTIPRSGVGSHRYEARFVM